MTSTTLQCPLPEVEVALAPYIRTRQEALSIRQRLTAHLAAQVSHTSHDTPVTHLDLACPPLTLSAHTIPSELSGLRRQYLEALEARTIAQRRRDVLLSELKTTRDDHLSDASTTTRTRLEKEKEDAATYSALLRQRRKLSRLQILLAGIDELVDNAPALAHTNLHVLMQEEVGTSPDPPSLTLEAQDKGPEVEELILKLKMSVVRAKKTLSDSQARKADIDAQVRKNPPPDTAVEIAALQHARDQLVNWIEDSLAQVGEESTLFHSPAASPQKRAAPASPPAVSLEAQRDRIQDLYATYLTHRASFVSLASTASASLSSTSKTKNPRPQPRQSTLPLNKPAQQPARISELLPYIPALLAASRTTNDLQGQTTYLRRQIASATSETVDTLKRLADESHMVPPRCDSVGTWVDAAREAKRGTEGAVEGHLVQGEQSVAKAKSVLTSLSERRENFSRIKGACDGK